jgi:DNA invertase Pin-like site-specific DNA recombinase
MSRSPTTATTLDLPSHPAIYARISDDRDGDELGVARQVRQCRELARRLGWPEPVVFSDNDITAFKRKRRPDWERLRAAIAAGAVDGLLAVHPDRFSRSDLRDLEDLIDLLDGTGIPVHTVNAGKYDLSTASGRGTARILGSVARMESERKAELIRDKMTELREAGRQHGRSPYGYRRAIRVEDGKIVKTLEVVPAEAAVVREVAERIIDGWSLRRICRDLNERGIPTKRGATVGWAPAVIRGMVKSPTMIGWRGHRGIPAAKGDWEPILDRRTWDRACAILADPARKVTRPAHRYLLAGLIWTAEDPPKRMRGHPHFGGYYRATGHTISTRATDDEVVARLWEHLRGRRSLPRPTDDAAEEAKAALDAAEEELAALARRRATGEIEQVEYEVLAVPLREAVKDAKARRTVTRGPDLRTLAPTPAQLRRRWEAGDMDLMEQREVLAAYIERIVIHPHTGRAGVWDPNRIVVEWRS